MFLTHCRVVTRLLAMPMGLLVCFAAVSSATEELPSVDDVLAAYVSAIGGEEAHRKITNRTVEGSVEIPDMGANGRFESIAMAPDKALTIVDLPGFGEIRQGFNGTVAWEKNPMMGIREKSGLELFATKLDAEFYRDIKLRETYPTMEVRGTAQVGERETYLIEGTPERGNPEKLYFDVENGLLLRQDIERESAQGMIPIKVYFEDYQEVDGIRIPFRVHQQNPALSMKIQLQKVTHNVSIDAAEFEKPTEDTP